MLKPTYISKIFFTLAITAIFMRSSAIAQGKIGELDKNFIVGCNYWASHSGIHMWRDWRPDVVERDFKQLEENGIKMIRVFPIWPDFQPIHRVISANGLIKYIAFQDEQPLPVAGIGSNGMSEEQFKHFGELADLAQRYHLKVIVGLITGWMSGQLYVPPALEGKNILSDPESLSWQQKFVSIFVTQFKNKPAIVAWDFGNECDVIEKLANHDQAYLWLSLLYGTIKAADPTRPVISGMHGLTAAEDGVWRIKDQAATTDILTTHPYSLWTRYASQDGVNSMRTELHAAAETRMCADIGGKPTLVEETGVMGPMTGSEKITADFARVSLFSNWVHDCTGTFWWCAYDQRNLRYPPYNFATVEAELGLIKEDRTPKPVMYEYKKFSEFIDHLPFKSLPERKTEAVCILTEGQDNWAVAYTSFVLAKQAGFDFQFQKMGQELKDASLYLMPSIKSVSPFFKNDWFKLLDKIKNGATLYISLDDTYLPTFNEPLGIEVLTNIKRRKELYFSSILNHEKLNFKTSSERKFLIDPKKATVLAKEDDGNPIFLKTAYGKGFIYLLTFPIESNLTTLTGAFDKGQPAYANIYKQIAQQEFNTRILTQENRLVGVTEHKISTNSAIVVLINYAADNATLSPVIKKGWNIQRYIYGYKSEFGRLRIKANDAIVLEMKYDEP